MQQLGKILREGGHTYTTFHVRPYPTKQRAEAAAKGVLSGLLPARYRKEDGGWWTYVLTPTNLDDFPPKLKIKGKVHDLQAAFSDDGKAFERRRLEEKVGRPAVVVPAVSLRGATYFAVYVRPSTKESLKMAAAARRKPRPAKDPAPGITGKWYGHKLPMRLYEDSIFETRKAAEAAKARLREQGEVVVIKPFEGWYAVYHTEGLGKTLKVEVKYATSSPLTKVGAHNARRDGQRRALPAGKRVSKFGKVYYEYRENRGDAPAELKEKWGESAALSWAKAARPKRTRAAGGSGGKNVVARLIAIGGKEWQSDRGLHRVYFNDLPGLYGLEVSRYKTGNVSSARLRGSSISNAQARRVESAFAFAKVWYDVGTKRFESKGMSDDDRETIVKEIRKRAKV
jgi:hypothetical protein